MLAKALLCAAVLLQTPMLAQSPPVSPKAPAQVPAKSSSQGVSPSAAKPPAQSVVPARANDNKARAGILYGSTLALRLEARLAEWHPNGDDEPGAVVPAFAEQGRAAQIPGPLIRVPGGTDVIVTVRNAIPNTTLTVHGLHARPTIGGGAAGAAFNDSITLPSGAMETLRFRLDRPGTYYYWGTTTGRAFAFRTREDAQLSGAIVVDEPGIGERPGNDRVLMISEWTDTTYSPQTRRRARELLVMNGRAWPYTERLQYARGDTVRWRVINASADLHAMHLHGYFFRVLRRGDGRVDTLQLSRDPENTERMSPGGTMYATWVASRLGNWLFHCDIPAHFMQRGALGYAPGISHASVAGTPAIGGGVVGGGGAQILPDEGLGGLVSDVEVKLGEDDSAQVTPLVQPLRVLRLIVNNGPPRLATAGPATSVHYYSIGLQEGSVGPEPQPDPEVHAGPPIVLNRGEPAQIMVVNRLMQPTSVHWHGIELQQSFFDGVPGVSGERPDTAGAIAPNDSFDVRLTPQRSGTFLYHSFVDAVHQKRAGFVGALIVVDKRTYDASRELPVLISSPLDSAEEERLVLINGSSRAAPVELKRGVNYRLRILNGTTTRPDLSVELRDSRDTTVTVWRPLAKDGADIPAPARTIRPAKRLLTIGETADFEFASVRIADYRLEARSGDGVVLGWLELRVR